MATSTARGMAGGLRRGAARVARAGAGGADRDARPRCQPSSGGDILAVPLVAAPRFSRTGSRVVGRHPRITIPARRGCIRSGARFVHRLVVSGRRSAVGIVSVRFFFDAGQLPRVDRTAPYRATYRPRFAPLSRHVAVARVAYRANGHTHTTTVGRMIVMCPA